MIALFDKLFLLAGCLLLVVCLMPEISLMHVACLLAGIIFSNSQIYCNPMSLPFRELPCRQKYLCLLADLLFLCFSMISPVSGSFLPLLCYEIFLSLPWYALLLPLAGLYVSFGGSPVFGWIACLLLCFAAVLLKYKTLRINRLDHALKQLRDTSTEYHLLLQQKNQDLRDKQDYEIHVATLTERNRIAREIHDNVGHMLSRSLLQSGALIAINKEEAMKEPLNAMKETLSGAMDSIRQSVHDLHDDSIDLQSAVSNMLKEFEGYETTLEYDMGNHIPTTVKYCLISILKEALSNISRHSNGTRIHILLREHPGFYQLMVKDNGTDISFTSPGMGLENMRERSKALRGSFTVSTDHGFRIFVSIPMQTKLNK